MRRQSSDVLLRKYQGREVAFDLLQCLDQQCDLGIRSRHGTFREYRPPRWCTMSISCGLQGGTAVYICTALLDENGDASERDSEIRMKRAQSADYRDGAAAPEADANAPETDLDDMAALPRSALAQFSPGSAADCSDDSRPEARVTAVFAWQGADQ